MLPGIIFDLNGATVDSVDVRGLGGTGSAKPATASISKRFGIRSATAPSAHAGFPDEREMETAAGARALRRPNRSAGLPPLASIWLRCFQEANDD
jgi:hypothetical protein